MRRTSRSRPPPSPRTCSVSSTAALGRAHSSPRSTRATATRSSTGSRTPRGRRRAHGGLRSSLPCSTRARRSTRERRLSGGGRRFEVLVGGAVLAVGQRCALARLALAGRRATARDTAVEGAGLDLGLDELDCGADALAHGPRDLRLAGDGEVAPDVLEERSVGVREVARVLRQAFDSVLAGGQDFAAVLELLLRVDVRVDQVLDGAINGSRVLIHAGV